VPSDTTFFEIATIRQLVEEKSVAPACRQAGSESAFHSRKNHSGFSAKKVRTSIKNVSKIFLCLC